MEPARKLLLRIVFVSLLLCLLCRPSVARGPRFGGAAARSLQQDGENDNGALMSPTPSETWVPSQSEIDEAEKRDSQPGEGAEDAEAEQEAEEEAEEEEEEAGTTYEDPENEEPVDDPNGGTEEPVPDFKDPTTGAQNQDEEPHPDSLVSGGDSGPSSVVIAFSVIGAIAFVAVIAGVGVFIFRKRRHTGSLEFKPLRETELSHENVEKGDDLEDESLKNLDRSHSDM